MGLNGQARASLGESLRRYRERRGWSREELAAEVEPPISADTIANVERGRTRPYRQTLLALCAALSLSEAEQATVLHAWRNLATPADIQKRDPPLSAVDVSVDELAAPAAPIMSQRLYSLPVELSSFVGREREIAEVARLLGTTRLVTLTGPGGVGKTRLARQVAVAAADSFANGIAFVPLASITSSELVTSVVARVLGVQEIAGRPLLATLQDALFDQAILLLLDNFEQVLGAAVQVAELLAACPRLTILVTSRAVLHVSGEHDYAVPPLRLPERESQPALEQLSQFEAVRLFIERARAARSDFAVNAESAPVVSEICQRLDGLPLAIELAAARIRVLSPQGIRARLGRRLDLLVGGARDQPERHHTLRAAVAWSYELLVTDEQALFRRLAVFAGGCRLEAVEAVCTEARDARTGTGLERSADTLGELISLVEQGLVQSTAQTDGEPRFWLLETIREYALEQLEASGEATNIRHRHAAYYLSFAEHAELRMLGRTAGADEREWLGRLEAEHDNLRAVLAWSQTATAGADDDDDPPAAIGLRVAGALGRFWFTRGYIGEGRRWLETTLVTGGMAGTRARAWALTGAGMLAREQGDYEHAATRFEEGIALGRTLGAGPIVASALRQLGLVVQAQGDARRATALLQESLEVGAALRDRWEVAQSLHLLGVIVHQQGDLERASALFAEGLALNRELKTWFGASWTLQDWGDLACDQGDYDHAAALFAQSLTIARDMDYTSRSAWALCGLGFIAALRGDLTQAAALNWECLAGFRRLGDRRGIVACLCNVATLAHARGDDSMASRLFGSAEAARKTLAAPWWLGERTRYERVLAAARTCLGEEVFAAAWAEGQALPVEDAIASGLARGTAAASSSSSGLTDP